MLERGETGSKSSVDGQIVCVLHFLSVLKCAFGERLLLLLLLLLTVASLSHAAECDSRLLHILQFCWSNSLVI